MMNDKARELGLKNTAFKTPHGLDVEGHYSTAYELAMLTRYALQNPVFAQIVATKSTTITTAAYIQQTKCFLCIPVRTG